jgi:SAM-dependent methyltransferase
MDAATVELYEHRADEWVQRRGMATDGLGRHFRDEVGAGLVADLGCGPGRYLAEIGGQLVGVDATAAMLRLARGSGYPLIRADLEALPFADGSLAGAFARHSYLHLPKDRLAAALSDVRRALRPGGKLLMTLIEGAYEGHHLAGDDFSGRYFALWSAPELAELLDAARFSDVRIERLARRRGAHDLIATARH